MKAPVPVPEIAHYLSRRGFLKLGATAVLGLFLPTLDWMNALAEAMHGFGDMYPDQQGRIIDREVPVYDIPSTEGEKVTTLWRDTIYPITDVTIGEEEPAYNRVWYRLGDIGYTHSGRIHPVRTVLNDVVSELPPVGQLGEVTVPYTDARWGPGNHEPFAYRYYYETTHWVTRLTQDAEGTPWYEVLDDKEKSKEEQYFYVPARHIHLISAAEVTPLSADLPLEQKRIEVRTPEQVIVAFEQDVPVFMARTATGAKFWNGDFTTPAGHHMVSYKMPRRHMAAGNLAANGYDLPGVPWNCFITEDGVAIHGTYWHNDFGKPRSHGCINVNSQVARWFYRWTLPFVPWSEQIIFEKVGTGVDVIPTEED